MGRYLIHTVRYGRFLLPQTYVRYAVPLYLQAAFCDVGYYPNGYPVSSLT